MTTRDYLTPQEIEQLIKAAKRSQHPLRDTALILLTYRHGLRISEAIQLPWQAIDLDQATLYVKRCKQGIDSNQPLTAKEMDLLNQLRQHNPASHYVLTNNKGQPLPRRTAYHIIRKTGEKAKLAFPIYPHMLRHSTGFYLANRNVATRTIQEYLGHRNIANTVRYTALAAGRFEGLWRD